MAGGRPSKYTKELATEICERIAKGESLRKICKDKDMPDRRIVHYWLLSENKKEFYHQYEIACNIRAENMFDGLTEIADLPDEKESPNRSRLRVDTRKWYLSKVLPKKYGDKLDLTSDNKPIPITNVLFSNNSNKEDTEPKEEN